MILVGNQRGNGRELAQHLLNARDNEHVTVHELRGFVSNDLQSAFLETEAISLGTKCKQYLFSLSLNPPADADVGVEDFQAAINQIEETLGLSGQPRAIVFHEKHARRHTHCVWSRIDADRMRGINISHYKNKLQTIARELYRTQDWEMPEGFHDKTKRDPNSFDRIEAAQAKSTHRDPKELKALFRDLWERSDSRSAFRAALLSEGFVLAQGSRRAFVAVDENGKTYSLSRWTGAGAKALRERLGLSDGLPSIEEARKQLPEPSEPMSTPKRDKALTDLTERHTAERTALLADQKAERVKSRRHRQAQLPRGLKAAWAKLTGQFDRIVNELAEDRNREESKHCVAMDRLIARQMAERRAYQARWDHQQTLDALAPTSRKRTYDHRQYLVLTGDMPLPSPMAVEFRPEAVLDHLSERSESFTHTDIANLLKKISDDVGWCHQLQSRLRASPELVKQFDDQNARFTTLNYLAAQQTLTNSAAALSKDHSFTADTKHLRRAIQLKNNQLSQTDGALSDEQIKALEHMTSSTGLACVVGTAGAGKSTLLDVARVTWQAEGRQVFGAALAGKAADGLEQSSGIPSRTLAALEKSWARGNGPITPGAVVVIDEVGMVGTQQLSRVMAKLSELRCKVVLIGDPDQLQPIEAGTPFRELLTRHDNAVLKGVRRQKEDWQRQASVQLAKGNIRKALDAYDVRGHVKNARHTNTAITTLVEDYLADMETGAAGPSRIALAHRRKDVFAINQGIRTGLMASGAFDDEIFVETEHGPRAFASGDRILFTRNDQALGVRNGMLGTVERAANGTLRIRLDDNQCDIMVDTEAYQSLDHGYAVSIHKSQGCTVDRTFVLGGRTMDRHLTYVALTRHRNEMNLYTEPGFKPERSQQYIKSRWNGPMQPNRKR